MSDIPIDTLERWALAVHQWLADDDQHGEVIADAMVATRLDRAAVLAGIQHLRDEGFWVIQVDDRGRITASMIDEPMFTRATPVACFHRRTRIDERTRTVTCRDCGSLVAPFDTLVICAQDELRRQASRDLCIRQEREYTKRLEATKREEANAKARVRTARDRASELEARCRQLQAQVEGLELLAVRPAMEVAR